jgi:hypothetical protein
VTIRDRDTLEQHMVRGPARRNSAPSSCLTADMGAGFRYPLMTVEPVKREPPRYVVSQIMDEPEELEEFVIEDQPMNLEEIEAKAIPSPEDPGMAAIGEIPGIEPTEFQLDDGIQVADTAVPEVGTLFGEGGQGWATAGDGFGGGAQFFGVQSPGHRFVFIVDSSKSMQKGKFEAACQELYNCMSRLDEQQSFYVLFFDWDAAKMFDQENPEPRMVRATPENVQRLARWMSTIELELKTNPYDCFEFAMKLMPDAIYVLSDGAFTDGGRAVKYMQKNNLIDDEFVGKRPKVTVHTIGFYTPDNGTLEKMAKDYHGSYRFVPRPPGAPGKKPGGPKKPGGGRKPGGGNQPKRP